MLSLLRFLVKFALVALVVAFASSIGMAYLFAHPEIKTGPVKPWVRHATHARK